MRMRVYLVRLAVRGPARVAYADAAAYRFAAVCYFVKRAQPPALLCNGYAFIVPNYCQARAVVSAVFKLFQPVQQQRRGLFISNVAHYSAHFVYSPPNCRFYAKPPAKYIFYMMPSDKTRAKGA